MPFMIKQHDLRPYLEGQLLLPDDTPLNLTGALGGFAIMRKVGEQIPAFRKPIVITDAALGEFEYQWETGDTDAIGEFDFEIEIDWAGEPQTFPVDGYYKVTVVDDLDNP
jgi:hypothetical protein